MSADARSSISVAVVLSVTWLMTFFSGESQATVPMFDRLEVNGQNGMLLPMKKGGIPLPPSEKLQELRRIDGCSASGGPRGKYRISDGKLWLISLYRCAGDIALENVYGGTGEAMFADWLSGDFVAHWGKILCRYRGFLRPALLEQRLSFHVHRGMVTQLRQESNVDHPDLPRDISGGITWCLDPP